MGGSEGTGLTAECEVRDGPPFRIRHSPFRIWSRPESVERPRKRDRLPNVRDPADPRHCALDPEAEARVDKRPVLSEVQVPAVRLDRQAFLFDAAEQLRSEER